MTRILADERGSILMALREHACYVLLKENEGRIFRLMFVDGEVARAKVIYVDDEYEDFVYDLISSTIPEHYGTKTEAAMQASFTNWSRPNWKKIRMNPSDPGESADRNLNL